jgi:hypothetical protein
MDLTRHQQVLDGSRKFVPVCASRRRLFESDESIGYFYVDSLPDIIEPRKTRTCSMTFIVGSRRRSI